MRKYFFLIVITGLLSSCIMGTKTNQFLLPSNISGNMKYMPKPYTKDSSKSTTYLQAGIQRYTGNENEDYFKTSAFELSATRGHQRKNFQFAYGGSFSAGSASYHIYDTSGKNPSKIKNSFSNLFLQASVNGVKTTRYAEFRYLSLDLGYSKEFGD